MDADHTKSITWEWCEVHTFDDAQRLAGFERWADGRWHRLSVTGWLVVYVRVPERGVDVWRGIRPVGGGEPRPDRSLMLHASEYPCLDAAQAEAAAWARHGWDVEVRP